MGSTKLVKKMLEDKPMEYVSLNGGEKPKAIKGGKGNEMEIDGF